MALSLVQPNLLSPATEERLADLRNALSAAALSEKLYVFERGAILAFTRAELEDDPIGAVSAQLEEIGICHNLIAAAGGQDALQHILSEARHGRRALPDHSAIPQQQAAASEVPLPIKLASEWQG